MERGGREHPPELLSPSLLQLQFKKVHNRGMSWKTHCTAQKISAKGPDTRVSQKEQGTVRPRGTHPHPSVASWTRRNNQKLPRTLVPLKAVACYLSSCNTWLLQPEGWVPSYLPLPDLRPCMWRTACIMPLVLRLPHTGKVEQGREGRKGGSWRVAKIYRVILVPDWRKAALNLGKS